MNAATDIHSRLLAAPAEPIAAHPGAPKLQRFGELMRITLDRPDEHNRLDPADVDALSSLFADIASRPPGTLRALLLTGAGERTFSSGYTLGAIGSELDERLDTMLERLERLPCLTIAVLAGSVYGGATDLALCCDLRIARQGIRMFMPAARFGLHYYPGGLRRYVTRLGLGAASKLMLTAMTIEADEMLRIGFLSEAVEPQRLGARVAEHLDALMLNDTGVVARMKADLLALAAGGSTAEQASLLAAIAQSHQQSLRSDVLRERLAERLGDRAPPGKR